MNRKEPTKTFMMISKRNKPFGLYDFCKYNLALQGLRAQQILAQRFHLLYMLSSLTPLLPYRLLGTTKNIDPLLG